MMVMLFVFIIKVNDMSLIFANFIISDGYKKICTARDKTKFTLALWKKSQQFAENNHMKQKGVNTVKVEMPCHQSAFWFNLIRVYGLDVLSTSFCVY